MEPKIIECNMYIDPSQCLLLCVKSSSYQGVLAALRDGADINAKDKNGDTSMHIAAQRGDTQLIKFLLSQGASFTETNSKGQTAKDILSKNAPRNTKEVNSEIYKECVKVYDNFLAITSSQSSGMDVEKVKKSSEFIKYKKSAEYKKSLEQIKVNIYNDYVSTLKVLDAYIKGEIKYEPELKIHNDHDSTILQIDQSHDVELSGLEESTS